MAVKWAFAVYSIAAAAADTAAAADEGRYRRADAWQPRPPSPMNASRHLGMPIGPAPRPFKYWGSLAAPVTDYLCAKRRRERTALWAAREQKAVPLPLLDKKKKQAQQHQPRPVAAGAASLPSQKYVVRRVFHARRDALPGLNERCVKRVGQCAATSNTPRPRCCAAAALLLPAPAPPPLLLPLLLLPNEPASPTSLRYTFKPVPQSTGGGGGGAASPKKKKVPLVSLRHTSPTKTREEDATGSRIAPPTAYTVARRLLRADVAAEARTVAMLEERAALARTTLERTADYVAHLKAHDALLATAAAQVLSARADLEELCSSEQRISDSDEWSSSRPSSSTSARRQPRLADLTRRVQPPHRQRDVQAAATDMGRAAVNADSIMGTVATAAPRAARRLEQVERFHASDAALLERAAATSRRLKVLDRTVGEAVEAHGVDVLAHLRAHPRRHDVARADVARVALDARDDALLRRAAAMGIAVSVPGRRPITPVRRRRPLSSSRRGGPGGTTPRLLLSVHLPGAPAGG